MRFSTLLTATAAAGIFADICLMLSRAPLSPLWSWLGFAHIAFCFTIIAFGATGKRA